MTRPIFAVIDSVALKHNYWKAKSIAPKSRIWAVVKANAYGHGIETVARTLYDADGFALLEIEQAIKLRRLGFKQPIMLLEGVFSPAELEVAAQYGLTVVIYTHQHIEWLQQAKLTKPLSIGLKLNTGMNRLGFPAELVHGLVRHLESCPYVADVMLMTHFANADEGKNGINWQYQRFCKATRGLNLPVCMANSASLIAYPDTRQDWVRPGLMLYGASPFPNMTAVQLGLQPVMSLVSRIIAIQLLNAGDGVGYGTTFLAPQAMRIGVVACGYADGYPRHAPTGTPVWVAGQRSQLVGRVSMDMATIDLSHIPQADLGSEVELWGRHISIDEVAISAETVSYELMCAISERVPIRETTLSACAF